MHIQDNNALCCTLLYVKYLLGTVTLNIGHTKSDHILGKLQVVVEKQFPTIEGMLSGAALSDDTILSELLAPARKEINTWDLINRGSAA